MPPWFELASSTSEDCPKLFNFSDTSALLCCWHRRSGPHFIQLNLSLARSFCLGFWQQCGWKMYVPPVKCSVQTWWKSIGENSFRESRAKKIPPAPIGRGGSPTPTLPTTSKSKGRAEFSIFQTELSIIFVNLRYEPSGSLLTLIF